MKSFIFKTLIVSLALFPASLAYSQETKTENQIAEDPTSAPTEKTADAKIEEIKTTEPKPDPVIDEKIAETKSVGEDKSEAPVEVIKTENAEVKKEVEETIAKEEPKPAEIVDVKKAENIEVKDSNISISESSIAAALSKADIDGTPIQKELLQRLYSGNKPLFFANGNLNDKGHRAIEVLNKAEENGLYPYDYDTKAIAKKINAATSGQQLADADVLIAQKIINFVQQVRYGKKLPKDVGFETYFRFIPKTLDVVSTANNLLTSSDIEKSIEGFSPKHEQYKLLKEETKKLIVEDDSSFRYIDDNGAKIAPAGIDYRIPLIRARMKAKRPLNPKEANNKSLYDSELVKVITKFQESAGLPNDGVIDSETIRRLNIGKKEKLAIIRMNMERYRWLPDNLGDARYIVIDLVDYKFQAFNEHELETQMSAIVGRAKRRTPIMNTMVLNMTFQPFWYVPRKYATELLIPKLQKDNRYLEHDGILLYQMGANGSQVEVDPTKVDWSKVTPTNYNFAMRQNPGEKNVLGQVKFALLNDKEIFMHGTSEPEVFSKELRAVSAGCIRVEDPLKVANYLVENNADKNWSSKELEEFYIAHKSGKPYEQRPKSILIDLKDKIPMYVVYFTAVVKDGQLVLKNDVYSVDEQMLAAYEK